MATIVEQAKAQMAKSVESTKENFSGIRTGRANPALLNGITVDYYGAPTPLKPSPPSACRNREPCPSPPFDASPGQRRREGTARFRSGRKPAS